VWPEDDALNANRRRRLCVRADLHRGHYEITVDVPAHDRIRVAFTDLAPYR
jgi:hypothetical protein